MFLIKGAEKKFKCLNYGQVICSKVNENKYYFTRKRIYVVNKDEELIKKIGLPQNCDARIREKMIELWDIFYSDLKLYVIISMRASLDRKSILNEETLEYGELTPYK